MFMYNRGPQEVRRFIKWINCYSLHGDKTRYTYTYNALYITSDSLYLVLVTAVVSVTLVQSTSLLCHQPHSKGHHNLMKRERERERERERTKTYLKRK